MRPREPRLFAEHDAQMKREHHDQRVQQKARRPERHRPAKQNQADADIHRVAREAIRARGDETARRVPRRERAFADDEEVADAPEQERDAGNEEDEREGVERALAHTRPRDQQRDEERHQPRQGEEGQQRSQQHQGEGGSERTRPTVDRRPKTVRPTTYLSSGLFRTWNFTSLLVVPLPPSAWNGARVA